VLCTCAHAQSTCTTPTLTLLYITLMALQVCEALQYIIHKSHGKLTSWNLVNEWHCKIPGRHDMFLVDFNMRPIECWGPRRVQPCGFSFKTARPRRPILGESAQIKLKWVHFWIDDPRLTNHLLRSFHGAGFWVPDELLDIPSSPSNAVELHHRRFNLRTFPRQF
jgi:hypothetical protein